MGTIFLRTIIIYLVVLIAIRLMGKREIGQLQPYELVATIIIADVASLPMQNVSISLIQGIVPILGLLFMQIAFSLLTFKSKKLQKVLSGNPTILMANGKLIKENLEKQKYTYQTLMEQIRVAGFYKLSDLDYIILETSGQISVIPKEDFAPATKKDIEGKKKK